MTTDPIKALVDLGPELERLTQAMESGAYPVKLSSSDVKKILAAIEALTPIAAGGSVVVPLYDLQKIILTIFNGDDPLDERNGARKSYDNLRSILSASPSASTGKDWVVKC